MPLVRIDLQKGKDAAYRQKAGQIVYEAMVAHTGVPKNDHFQIIGEHAIENFIFDPDYLGIDRRDVVFVRITLVEGRSNERKKELYRTIVTNLEAVGVRREDVVISLTETGRIDWSIGNGVAQLVETSPAST